MQPLASGEAESGKQSEDTHARTRTRTQPVFLKLITASVKTLAQSLPKKPITYYIDPSVPLKWRPYLKAGVEAWNDAFFEAGFISALSVTLSLCLSSSTLSVAVPSLCRR